jgi:subtilase family serine protease
MLQRDEPDSEEHCVKTPSVGFCTLVISVCLTALGALAVPPARAAALPAPQPYYSDAQLISASGTPPSEAQCESVGRRCFNPQSTHAAYRLAPLYAQGLNGRGQTIAIVDSYGSDTIAHDLHVYNQAFGLQPMCGEEGVTCTAGMPTFSVLSLQGSPATKAPPSTSKSPAQEDKSAWALEVSLDVETAHAIAPMANIILVTTPTAETLGVQGFPQMMAAEDYIVKNHLASVISMSLGAAEESFASSQSLLNLRDAFKHAAQNGVTVLAASGDGGTENGKKNPVGHGGSVIPYPTVGWPASDPLVTGIGGTYLCTNANEPSDGPRIVAGGPPASCAAHAGEAEVGWTFSGGGFSHVFAKPSFQNTLPAGSTAIASTRGVPDVAFQASAGTGALVYVTLPPDGNSGLLCGSVPCSTGWYDIGGTSLSTPQWAGLVAIAAQLNGGGLGLINPALYAIGANPQRYAQDFYDITSGLNQADPAVPGYPATTGWDPITGLGTPNAANLIPDLVAAVHGH